MLSQRPERPEPLFPALRLRISRLIRVTRIAKLMMWLKASSWKFPPLDDDTSGRAELVELLLEEQNYSELFRLLQDIAGSCWFD